MGLAANSAKKLASLSALGAGALALTADTAEASIIVSTNTLIIDCGCTGVPYGVDMLSDAFHNVYLIFGLAGTSRSTVTNYVQYFSGIKAFGVMYSSSGGAPVRWQVQPAVGLNATYAPEKFLRLFPAGAAWPGTGGSTAFNTSWATAAGIAVAHKRFDVSISGTPTLVGSGSTLPNPYDPVNKYALFSFTDAKSSSTTYYGWANIGISQGPDGPIVTLRSWAYDDTGAQIYAGEGEPVPEPSTMALAGIAALALGARGIRRWRAERNPS